MAKDLVLIHVQNLITEQNYCKTIPLWFCLNYLTLCRVVFVFRKSEVFFLFWNIFLCEMFSFEFLCSILFWSTFLKKRLDRRWLFLWLILIYLSFLHFQEKNLDDTRRVWGAYSFVRSLNKKLLIRHYPKLSQVMPQNPIY